MNYKIFGGKFLLTFFLATALFAAQVSAQNSNDPNPDVEANQNQAIETFNRGQDAHEKGDLAAAVKLYAEALKLFPEFPEAEYQRGAALVSLSDLPEAEKAFRRAIALREDWSLAWAKLGDLLVRKHAESIGNTVAPAEEQHLFAEADKVLQKAIELDGNNFLAFVALTELRLRSATPVNILKALLAQLRNISDGKANVPASVWTARAALERKLGNVQAARASVNRALKIEPNSISARLERAELLALNGDFNAALDDAGFAEKSASKEHLFEARLLLARLHTETGNVTEALKIIDSLSATEKRLPAVVDLSNFIQANSAEGTVRIKALEKLLDANPKNIAVISRLCNYSRTVAPEKALDYCRRASELEPYNASHAVGFSAALVQARQYEQAVELLRKILELAPNNYTARANLAKALHELKRFPEAIFEFQKMIDVRPDVAASYFYLATAHDSIGEYREAMAAYQKYLQLADARQNQFEIDQVKSRLPNLAKQLKKGEGKNKSPKL